MQVPMFAVQQKRLCGLSGLQAGDAGCLLTLIKAQIPFEVPGDPVLSDQKVHALPLPAVIRIDVDGAASRYSHYLTTATSLLPAMPRGTPQVPASAIARCSTPMAHL